MPNTPGLGSQSMRAAAQVNQMRQQHASMPAYRPPPPQAIRPISTTTYITQPAFVVPNTRPFVVSTVTPNIRLNFEDLTLKQAAIVAVAIGLLFAATTLAMEVFIPLATGVLLIGLGIYILQQAAEYFKQ